MTDFLLHLFGQIPAQLSVLLLAMAPITELRAAIPVGIGVYQLPLLQVIPIVLVGNMVPAILILYGWDWCVSRTAKHWPWLGGLMNKWYEKTQVQWDTKIEKYGPWALVLFVAIPLPGSGVWSGALAAWIFKLEKKKALLSIFIGILLSTALVLALTVTGINLFSKPV